MTCQSTRVVQVCYISKLTIHTPHPGNLRHVLLPWKLPPTPTNMQMRTLRIKLRLIRTMQTNDLMADKIPPRPQVLRNSLGPQTRTAIPHTKRLLKPRSFLNGTFQQPSLADLEPVGYGAVEHMAVIGFVGAVREPDDHGTDGVDPVPVDRGDILTCRDGHVCARRCAGRVAREGDVVGLEDGVVGNPFALDHPCAPPWAEMRCAAMAMMMTAVCHIVS
ncbi:hypothetical protein HBH79_124760 [Parastagonospora nodorum]|nr:hypothetical protein HBH43_109070 [Parastagonospora nodorum]KAH4463141.1 hypothetical protein HBH90_117730 [Parastagonospora nodorum]KAH4483751.1 hypothetical protein HBH88_144950 [Parastagonospora nodorum]KAH4513678.1 hypothetical protein HBH87_132920 [Parastagonospora nodorum]KAH4673864.1 hypothetical protein HBH79_124760 [Parastagonospora nodorum]